MSNGAIVESLATSADLKKSVATKILNSLAELGATKSHPPGYQNVCLEIEMRFSRCEATRTRPAFTTFAHVSKRATLHDRPNTA